MPGLGRLPHWEDALEGAEEALAALRQSFRDDPPDRFVERLRSTWLAEATAAARHLGRHRVARLQAFYAALSRVLLERGGSRSEVARFLRRAVERAQESREPTAAEVAADAVRVMTIHGAKGLDFGHVYLLQLHRESTGGGERPTRTLRLAGEPQYCVLGWPTPGFLRAEAWQARVADAELVRLLYVAATRAKQRVVLAGAWPDPGGGRRPRGLRLMDLVLPRCRREDGAPLERPGPGRGVDGDGVQWVDPALALGEVAGRATEVAAAGSPPSAAAMWREAEALGARRARAEERMARAIAGAATAEVHRGLERDASRDRDDEGHPPLPRDVATAVGSAVHRLLETLDLGSALAPQVEDARGALALEVERDVEPGLWPAAREHLGFLLDRLLGGELLVRLQALAPHVAARELPLLLPPDPDRGPVGFLAARVDLVFVDPSSGELVVADYKTDRLDPGPELEERARVYAPQVELYARGLQEALGLERTPRAELWFLAADRVLVAPAAG